MPIVEIAAGVIVAGLVLKMIFWGFAAWGDDAKPEDQKNGLFFMVAGLLAALAIIAAALLG